MKKLLSVLLTLTLLLALSAPAFAVNMDEVPAPAATVSTFEELQTAIDETNSRVTTIEIASTITFDGVQLNNDWREKAIFLIRSADFSEPMFLLKNGSEISGFNFLESENETSTIIIGETSIPVSIHNCWIENIGATNTIYVNADNSAIIEDCSFSFSTSPTLSISSEASVTVKGSNFANNKITGSDGVINNYGTLYMERTFVNTNSTEIGSVQNHGKLTLYQCQVTYNEGGDIRSDGELNILDNPIEGEGYFDTMTGKKLDFPLYQFTETVNLIYNTDETAAELFPSTPPDDEEQEQEPQEQEQEDEEQENGEQEREEAPPAETPTEPQTPEESTDTDNTPPASPAPTYTPPTYSYSRPSGRSTTPTTTIEEDPAIKADAPALVFACGEAVIDRTRSVVLAGYDDGELHLDDTLTRAQMATIIYRLLDADTLAKFDTAESAFNDVSPNAWYSRYVSTIAKAGIVVGTGNGYYSPDGTLTWAQILTVLSRFVAPQAYTLQNIQYDGWAAEAIQTAAALGWIEDAADFAPNAVITRGEFVELVNGVLALNSTV